MDINPIVVAACALGCACVGGIGMVALLVLRTVGGQFFDVIGSLLGRGSGGDDVPERNLGGERRAPASEAIRQQARALDFNAALQQQGGAVPPPQAFGAQSAPNYGGQYPPQGNYPAFPPQQPPQGNYPAFPPQQPPQGNYPAFPPQQAPQGNYPAFPPQQAPQGNYPAFPPQQAPQGNYPAFPPQQPPQGSYGGMVQRPPQAPSGAPNLGARRPSLSAPRQLGSTSASESSGFDDFNANVPGLRNQRRRRTDGDDVYDDEGDDVAGGLGNFFGL
jgi:hypothetical protein